MLSECFCHISPNTVIIEISHYAFSIPSTSLWVPRRLKIFCIYISNSGIYVHISITGPGTLYHYWGLVGKSCLTLWPYGLYSPPGFFVHRISQARLLEWVAISFSRDLPDPGIKPTSLSHQGSPYYIIAVAAAKSLQSCLTLCDPIDGNPPGSTTSGILQARTLEWVAISFSNAWKWKVKVSRSVVSDS